MERIFEEKLSKVRSKLQRCVIKVSSQVKSVAAITNPEDESTESNKAFYLIRLMLFMAFIFLAPDKIPQTFTIPQAVTGIFEKAQEIAKIFKKLMPKLT